LPQIDRKPTSFDPLKFEDRYEDALIEMIRAKMKGKKLPQQAAPPRRDNVVTLASLIQKSLETGGGKTSANARGKNGSPDARCDA
jgi:DNA end-binding protein Ku